MKILILGATGMLGSQVAKTFAQSRFDTTLTARKKSSIESFVQQGFHIEELDVENTDTAQLKSLVKDADWCINCIGLIKPYINDRKPEDVAKAVRINALFPAMLAQAVQGTRTRVIQIATDCVWNGEGGSYKESCSHNAQDIYGKSKSLGEIDLPNFYNIRCSIIGREIKQHLSLMDWFLNQPQKAKVKGFTNHLWNGVTTLQFAKLCYGIVSENAALKNQQHFVPADTVDKYKLLNIFANTYAREDISIESFAPAVAVDRSIQTEDTQHNTKLWHLAGYSTPPTIEKMIKELYSHG